MAGFGDIVGHEQVISHLKNAISMGKDLQHLTNYKLTQIQLFDMFPHTAHYEALTLLELNP